MRDPGQRKFIAFASGLDFGAPRADKAAEFITTFLRGELFGVIHTPDGQLDQRVLPAQIQRLVLCGNSTKQPEKIDEVQRGSYRTAQTNADVYSSIKNSYISMDAWLEKLAPIIDVDVIPGANDFSNSFLPQQPLNSCMFPTLVEKNVTSLNLTPNPHQFKMDGLIFLGTAGQNIQDILRNRRNIDELGAAVHTMELRHLCPTAPDTLRVHPFKEHDPFVVADSDLQLNDDDEMAGESKDKQSIYTVVPHVYFVGNASKYAEKLVQEDKQFMKVFTVPAFSQTHSMVLLDTATLETYEITFSPPTAAAGSPEKVQTPVSADEKMAEDG